MKSKGGYGRPLYIVRIWGIEVLYDKAIPLPTPKSQENFRRIIILLETAHSWAFSYSFKLSRVMPFHIYRYIRNSFRKQLKTFLFATYLMHTAHYRFHNYSLYKFISHYITLPLSKRIANKWKCKKRNQVKINLVHAGRGGFVVVLAIHGISSSSSSRSVDCRRLMSRCVCAVSYTHLTLPTILRV